MITKVLGLAAACLAASGCDRGPIRPRSEFAAHRSDGITACASGATVPGVDVSTYQGPVDWSQAASAGLAFAIARISDGTQSPDDQFAANWPGIKAAGMIRGAYQFYEAGEDPTAQANLVVQAVGQLQAGDLPVTMDLESGGGVASVAQIQTWINVVTQGTGKTPMIYTSPGYWDSYFGAQFASVPLWVADWGPSCPDTPTGWSGWQFWQTADSGSTAGIGDSDQDVFNGSLAALQTFAGATPQLQNPTFSSGLSPWVMATSNEAIYTSSSAPSGNDYLEVNGTLSDSFYQDVALLSQADQTWILRVSYRINGSGSDSANLVLWGMGGPNGDTPAQTNLAIADGNWHEAAVELGPLLGSYTGLRAQIYLNTAGVNFDFTNFSLVAGPTALLTNSSFGTGGTAPWVFDAANEAVYNNPSQAAPGNTYYLETNSNASGQSFYQDVAAAPQAGSYWILRATYRINGAGSATLALWGLGGPSGNTPATATLGDADGQWHNAAAILGPMVGTYSSLRAQVYLNTTGVNFDFDNFSLNPCGDPQIADPGFESGLAPWVLNTTNEAVYDVPAQAAQGDYFLEANVNTAGQNLYQDIAVGPQPGDLWTLSMSYKIKGAGSETLVLWGLSGVDGSNTPAQVVLDNGDGNWHTAEVSFIPTEAYSSLRAQVYLSTTSVNYDFDAFSLTLFPPAGADGGSQPLPASDAGYPGVADAGHPDVVDAGTPVEVTDAGSQRTTVTDAGNMANETTDAGIHTGGTTPETVGDAGASSNTHPSDTHSGGCSSAPGTSTAGAELWPLFALITYRRRTAKPVRASRSGH